MFTGEYPHSGTDHAALYSRQIFTERVMSEVHEQLVAALRAVVAQSPDAHVLVVHALEDVEREQPAWPWRSGEEVPGPYAPNTWSIYAQRTH